MRYLTLGEVVELYEQLVRRTGGSSGIRDLRSLESAIAQPKASFGGKDLHPTLVDKAAAFAFSIVGNHPFVDGNKRAGHAAMALFLTLNGHAIQAPVDEQEKLMLDVASGNVDRAALAEWLRTHTYSIEE